MSPSMKIVAGTCKVGRRVRGVLMKANSIQVISSSLRVTTQ